MTNLLIIDRDREIDDEILFLRSYKCDTCEEAFKMEIMEIKYCPFCGNKIVDIIDVSM